MYLLRKASRYENLFRPRVLISPIVRSPSALNPRPVTLTGQHIRLEPLSKDHAPGLYEAGRFPQVWEFVARGPAPFASLVDAERWVADALRLQVEDDQIPFAYIHLASETAIGTSRYLDIRRTDRAIEVGWT